MEAAEPLWHHANHEQLRTFEMNSHADGGGVGGEQPRPQPVTDHGHAIACAEKGCVPFVDGAAKNWRDAKGGEAATGDQRANGLDRRALGFHGQDDPAVVGVGLDERRQPLELPLARAVREGEAVNAGGASGVSSAATALVKSGPAASTGALA